MDHAHPGLETDHDAIHNPVRRTARTVINHQLHRKIYNFSICSPSARAIWRRPSKRSGAAVNNPERLRNEASLAALCGVNPLSASSGKTVRHSLNRGGNRTANNALWTIAMVRMRGDPQTQSYVARRSAQGLSSKEIQRCLKRDIVRKLYPLILADLADPARAC